MNWVDQSCKQTADRNIFWTEICTKVTWHSNLIHTLALAGTTLISWTNMASGFIMSTTGLLVLCVIQYISPTWPGTSDHWTNGWLLLLPLLVPLLQSTTILLIKWSVVSHINIDAVNKSFVISLLYINNLQCMCTWW